MNKPNGLRGAHEYDVLQDMLEMSLKTTHYDPLPSFIGSGKHLIKSGGKEPRHEITASPPRVLVALSPRVAARMGL